MQRHDINVGPQPSFYIEVLSLPVERRLILQLIIRIRKAEVKLLEENGQDHRGLLQSKFTSYLLILAPIRISKHTY